MNRARRPHEHRDSLHQGLRSRQNRSVHRLPAHARGDHALDRPEPGRARRDHGGAAPAPARQHLSGLTAMPQPLVWILLAVLLAAILVLASNYDADTIVGLTPDAFAGVVW